MASKGRGGARSGHSEAATPAKEGRKGCACDGKCDRRPSDGPIKQDDGPLAGLFDKKLGKQFGKFLMVGFTAFLVDNAVTNGLYYGLTRDAMGNEAGLQVAQIIAVMCAATWGYYLNKRFTFKDTTSGTRNIGVQLTKQFIWVGIAILIRTLIIFIVFRLEGAWTVSDWFLVSSLVDLFGFERFAYFTAVGTMIFLDYAVARRFIFLEKEH